MKIIHIYQDDDIRAHTRATGCKCEPLVDITSEDGETVYTVIHVWREDVRQSEDV
jgi:hypothetical protein